MPRRAHAIEPQGDITLPRKKTDDYGWLAVHMPNNLGDVLRAVAERERRSLSNMARLLIEEALRTRGETIPDRPVGTTAAERAKAND